MLDPVHICGVILNAFCLFVSERAADTTTEAKAVQEEAKRLAEEAKKGQKKIDKGEVETRIKKLYDHENATNDLLRQAKEANKTAHYAIVNGTRTLELAKNDLRLLEVGDAVYEIYPQAPRGFYWGLYSSTERAGPKERS